jgi:ergothioneine biosynthesis protein EgtB
VTSASNSPLAAGAAAGADTDLERRYLSVRHATEQLCEPLSAEDCVVQSMPNCSPAKWHLAHTSWFFETFVLERGRARYNHYNPEFRVLFNSYYKTVGEQYLRPQRGLLTRPGLDEIYDYRRHVDAHMQEVMRRRGGLPASVAAIIELGLNHEQQHQELILTDIKHMFSFNPLRPVYRNCNAARPVAGEPLRWHRYEEGIKWIGHEGTSFAFDNETPRHRVFVEAFELAGRAVTNREYLEFMAACGYGRPEFWLSDGWDAVQGQGWLAPLYWTRQDGAWFTHTLSGLRELALDEPVCHVSYYEADAFARWAEARLPTEMEWECAAGSVSIEGNFVESGLLHPAPAQGTSERPAQMFGDVWEWTRSPYMPYPGFTPAAGALGEYNGKFMCNQMVLRGGSTATPRSHIRATYRNFFQPDTRWQFSSFRLARDIKRG